MLINIFAERKQMMRITENKFPFFYLGINKTYTQIAFVPTILPHKFFIHVDNPLEMLKILCFVDDNNVLKGIFKQMLKMIPNVDKHNLEVILCCVSLLIGKKIPVHYFKQVFDNVSYTDQKMVQTLYLKTRKG
jgi:hypothetical protein